MIQDTPVLIRRLPHAKGLDLPSYETEGSAGCDLRAAIEDDIVLQPGERRLIPTGLQIALSPGTEAQVRPRSGLSSRHGITMINSPGTVDSDYRGELKVPLVNLGQEAFTVTRGMRIAQMVIAHYLRASFEERNEALPESVRGEKGFGSTGV